MNKNDTDDSLGELNVLMLDKLISELTFEETSIIEEIQKVKIKFNQVDKGKARFRKNVQY
jgi:hypothetical protein